jgi:hypothetical protein
MSEKTLNMLLALFSTERSVGLMKLHSPTSGAQFSLTRHFLLAWLPGVNTLGINRIRDKVIGCRKGGGGARRSC